MRLRPQPAGIWESQGDRDTLKHRGRDDRPPIGAALLHPSINGKVGHDGSRCSSQYWVQVMSPDVTQCPERAVPKLSHDPSGPTGRMPRIERRDRDREVVHHPKVQPSRRTRLVPTEKPRRAPDQPFRSSVSVDLPSYGHEAVVVVDPLCGSARRPVTPCTSPALT